MNFSLGVFDTLIIVGYFALTLFIGLAMTRKASSSLEDYYLGGRKLPWYLLGMAGMANWFDLTGTMIITSFLYLLGPRGLFIEFRGGAVLVLAFLVCYTGKWHRRSGCMTAAEWITYRFGAGKVAEVMRFLTAFMAIITTIGLMAYLVRGTSLFVGMFIPLPPLMVTAGLIAFCTLYTMLAGFYGVVLTDVVQGIILLVACVVVATLAFNMIPSLESLAETARAVTGSADWVSSTPQWQTSMPQGYEMYDALIMVALFYLLRNVLAGMGTGAENRYFAARSDRDCALQSMLQGIFVAFRWPMMIGFAVMGVYLVANLFPSQGVTAKVAAIVRADYPEVKAAFWHDLTSDIVNHPQHYKPEMVAQIQAALGTDWRKKLPLVSYRGTVNPEQILAAVMLNSIPEGLKGFLLVAMLAAMMSTLTGTINQTSGLFVRDIYQNFLRPLANNRELIICSYIFTFALVAASFWMGVVADSINDLWGWIIMGLGAGGLAPGLLRLYWWRCNAWGVVGGTVLGGVGALVQRALYPGMLEWQQFVIMTSLSFVGTIVGSLVTAPTSQDILRHFYRTTRPFGLWKPFKDELAPAERTAWTREHRNDMISVPFVLVAQVTAFLLPMQLVIHAYTSFFATLPIFLVAVAGIYWFWWRNLPPKDNPGTERGHGQVDIQGPIVGPPEERAAVSQ